MIAPWDIGMTSIQETVKVLGMSVVGGGRGACMQGRSANSTSWEVVLVVLSST
jgi:hypothetical protein